MSKHTPGPCDVEKIRGVRRVFSSRVGTIADVGLQHTPATEEANARLIAAAPDLLAACEGLISATYEADPDWRNDGMFKAAELARVALAKARGNE